MQTTKALVGESGGKAPWSWNTSSFWTFNGSRKFACFLIFGDAKKSQLSTVCMIQDHFPRLFKNNIFLDISLTTQIPWLSPVFPDLQEPWILSNMLPLLQEICSYFMEVVTNGVARNFNWGALSFFPPPFVPALPLITSPLPSLRSRTP